MWKCWNCCWRKKFKFDYRFVYLLVSSLNRFLFVLRQIRHLSFSLSLSVYKSFFSVSVSWFLFLSSLLSLFLLFFDLSSSPFHCVSTFKSFSLFLSLFVILPPLLSLSLSIFICLWLSSNTFFVPFALPLLLMMTEGPWWREDEGQQRKGTNSLRRRNATAPSPRPLPLALLERRPWEFLVRSEI